MLENIRPKIICPLVSRNRRITHNLGLVVDDIVVYTIIRLSIGSLVGHILPPVVSPACHDHLSVRRKYLAMIPRDGANTRGNEFVGKSGNVFRCDQRTEAFGSCH